jgi:Tol biopolymer transport system component
MKHGLIWASTLLILLVACGKTTKPTVDTTPPAAVQSLAVTSPAEGSRVTLSWSAPGDDGLQGQAARYDIRYSGISLTEDRWDSASVVASPPTPKPPGQTEHFDIVGLPVGTYWFALKAADEVPNWSAMSNVVSATVADTIPPGSVTDLTITSTTLDGATLSWTAPGNDGAEGRAVAYDLRYATVLITDQTWDASIPVQDPPLPAAAGAPESFAVSGLETGQTYYFALKTADGRPNWSALSNVASGRIVDITPPARVTDLRVPATTSHSVTVSWTAPGDDGTVGTAAQYDLRYATATITEGTWEVAMSVQGVPAPRTAGTRESFTVAGLEAGRLYFFALKTADGAPNWSALSTVISALPDSVPLRRLTICSPQCGPAMNPTWSPDGSEIAFHANWVGGSRNDIYRIPAAGGTPVWLTRRYTSFDNYLPSWSPDGEKIAFASGLPEGEGKQGLWVMNAADGSQRTQLASPDGEVKRSAWSPDGTEIAYCVLIRMDDPTISHIYVIPSVGGTPVNLTGSRPNSYNGSPAWSPDGTRLAFASDRSGSQEIWVMPADGGEAIQLTHTNSGYCADPTWSPDGDRIAFCSNRTGDEEIWVMSATGEDLTQLTFDPASDVEPAWSPDGSRIAFSSLRTGKFEIWVLQMATPGARSR